VHLGWLSEDRENIGKNTEEKGFEISLNKKKN